MPQAMIRRAAAVFLAVLICGLALTAWSRGAFDEPLSYVSLNHEVCGDNLLGNRMCGEDFVDYCISATDTSRRCLKAINEDQ